MCARHWVFPTDLDLAFLLWTEANQALVGTSGVIPDMNKSLGPFSVGSGPCRS